MKAIAVTDEITSCECCGRMNLKRTVVLQDNDGHTVHYGTTCAALAVKGKRTRTAALFADIRRHEHEQRREKTRLDYKGKVEALEALLRRGDIEAAYAAFPCEWRPEKTPEEKVAGLLRAYKQNAGIVE